MAESLNMDTIAQYLRDAGYPNAYVEMTGGGCATIYAGPTFEQPDYGTRYFLVAGPGSFGNPSYSDAGDFGFSIDLDEQPVSYMTTPEDDERTTADKMVAFLQRVTRFRLVDNKWGFTYEGTFITDPRVDESMFRDVQPEYYGLTADDVAILKAMQEQWKPSAEPAYLRVYRRELTRALIGPFKSHDDAAAYYREHYPHEGYEILTLTSPAEKKQ